jgi:hypothetical protein
MLKYLPKQQSSQRALFSFLLFSSLFFLGCAVLDPHEVGQGQYYQVKNSNGKVIVENNSAGSGFINCPNTATQQINSNPVLKGRIQCATSPSTDTLPYTIKIDQNKATQQSNVGVFKSTSAYSIRYAIQAACLQALNTLKSDSKWIIVEDNCSGASNILGDNMQPSKVTAPVVSNARFLQSRRLGSSLNTPLVQIATQNNVQCQAALKTAEQFLKSNGNIVGEVVACVDKDALFTFSATMKNELDGELMVLTTKTMPLCQSLVTSLKETLIPKINMKQYSVVQECRTK